MQIEALLRKTLAPKYSDLNSYIYSNGGLLVFVGGIVRDLILSRPTKDVDIECYCLQKDRLSTILAERYVVKYVGANFGVFKLADFNIDIALPRTDKCIGKKHTSFAININVFSSYHQSAIRRDLTINSIGYCMEHNLVLDPFGGVNDLQKKIIHPVNVNTFLEDPLRLLRSVYFASKMSFTFSPVMRDLYINNLSLVDNISAERISEEIKKILSCKDFSNNMHYLSMLNIKQFDIFRAMSTMSQAWINKLNAIDIFMVKILFIYVVSPGVLCSIGDAGGINKKYLLTVQYTGQVICHLHDPLTHGSLNLFQITSSIFKYRIYTEVIELLDSSLPLFVNLNLDRFYDAVRQHHQYNANIKKCAATMADRSKLRAYAYKLYDDYIALFANINS